jgi:flagellar operon protein
MEEVRLMAFRVVNGRVVPVEMPQSNTSTRSTGSTPDFGKILENELNRAGSVKISNHAMERLRTRNIELDTADMKKLTQAIDRASEKGSRESLLLYKDVAFIASIRNRTIITAVDGDSAKDNVFTNIDSAVIIS